MQPMCTFGGFFPKRESMAHLSWCFERQPRFSLSQVKKTLLTSFFLTCGLISCDITEATLTTRRALSTSVLAEQSQAKDCTPALVKPGQMCDMNFRYTRTLKHSYSSTEDASRVLANQSMDCIPTLVRLGRLVIVTQEPDNSWLRGHLRSCEAPNHSPVRKWLRVEAVNKNHTKIVIQ